MVFARITGIIIILFGIFTGLTYFKILQDTYFGYNIVMVGIIIFIAHELFALVMNLFNDSNKIVSIGVPLIFIAVAASYFVRSYIPEAIVPVIPLITAAFMCAEGLYRLH